MDYKGILYTVENKIATITFNRPEVQNGFNVDMCKEILDAIERSEAKRYVCCSLMQTAKCFP